MSLRWNVETRRALGELLGLPESPRAGDTPSRASVPIAEVREILELDEPLLEGFRGPERWLAGSSVTGWLVGDFFGKGKPADYDLNFASLDALRTTLKELLNDGWAFRCFRTFLTVCQRCGRPAQLVRVDDVDNLSFPLPRVRCTSCGEHGGIEAEKLGFDDLAHLTPQLIASSRMVCIETKSPDGMLYQLVTAGFGPTPHEALASSDFTITQFVIDHRNLYFSPNAWPDLIRNHLRFIAPEGATLRNCGRMWKYLGRGFRPSLGTFARVHVLAVRHALKSSEGVMFR